MLSVKVHTEPPSDLAAVPTESPTQPKIKFPLRQFGVGRPRGFSRDWYESYQWLEYSVERDAAAWHFVSHAECLKLEAVDVRAHLQ